MNARCSWRCRIRSRWSISRSAPALELVTIVPASRPLIEPHQWRQETWYFGIVMVTPGASRDAYFLENLSPEERAIAGSITAPERGDEYVTSRWLARCVLGRAMGMLPDVVPLVAPRGLAPTVTGGYVSLSHSQGLVAIAASQRVPVGVDVEEEGDHLVALAQRFVRPAPPVLSVAGAAARWVSWEAHRKLGGASTQEHIRRVESPDGRAFALGVVLAA